MWLKYWEQTGGIVAGKVNLSYVARLTAEADTDYGGDFVVNAWTSDGYKYRLTANSTLSSQADALAKIDDILVNGN